MASYKLDEFDKATSKTDTKTNKTTLNDSILTDRNGGIANESVGGGQTFIIPFALDRSALANPASSERNGTRPLRGGIDNLAHSIPGASAKQNDDKGRKDRT